MRSSAFALAYNISIYNIVIPAVVCHPCSSPEAIGAPVSHSEEGGRLRWPEELRTSARLPEDWGTGPLEPGGSTRARRLSTDRRAKGARAPVWTGSGHSDW